jgi:heme/copper-type cytochrome/quinol oxidase subunit 1
MKKLFHGLPIISRTFFLKGHGPMIQHCETVFLFWGGCQLWLPKCRYQWQLLSLKVCQRRNIFMFHTYVHYIVNTRICRVLKLYNSLRSRVYAKIRRRGQYESTFPWNRTTEYYGGVENFFSSTSVQSYWKTTWLCREKLKLNVDRPARTCSWYIESIGPSQHKRRCACRRGSSWWVNKGLSHILSASGFSRHNS